MTTSIDATRVHGDPIPIARTPSTDSGEVEVLAYLRGAALPLSSIVLALFDQSDDCIKLLDADGRLRFMNCNGRVAMEVDDFAMLDGQNWSALWPAESAGLVDGAIRDARAGEVGRFEAFCPTAKGAPRWWDVRVSPIRDERGQIAAILASSRDITDRHQTQEQLVSVATEMKHRLRNAYSIGAAITSVSGREQPDHARFADEVAARLTRLAEVQTGLLDNPAGMRLDQLLEPIIDAYGHTPGDWRVGPLPDLALGERTARALALALGELATNSLKYGALGSGGHVAVDAGCADGVLTIAWRDRREGEALIQHNPVTSRGHGSRLLGRMIAAAEGAIEQGPVDGGYDATLTLRTPTL